MVTKRLSLTETSVQNLLTAKAKSLLHTSKKKKVELPRCYCNNEWYEYRPKNTKRQNIQWNFILQRQTKNGQKNGQILKTGQMCFFMASRVKKWPHFSKLAMKWLIWKPWSRPHECKHWRRRSIWREWLLLSSWFSLRNRQENVWRLLRQRKEIGARKGLHLAVCAVSTCGERSKHFIEDGEPCASLFRIEVSKSLA